MARAGSPPSGWGRCDEPAAAGPTAAPAWSGDADGSRGGCGGFFYFSALALRPAAREGSVMVAVATGHLPGNARAGPALPRHGAEGLGRAVAAVTVIPARRWEWGPGARSCVAGIPPMAGDSPGPLDIPLETRGDGAARLSWCPVSHLWKDPPLLCSAEGQIKNLDNGLKL